MQERFYFCLHISPLQVGPSGPEGFYFGAHMIATTIGADRTNEMRGERYSQKKKESGYGVRARYRLAAGWLPRRQHVWGSSRDTAATKLKTASHVPKPPKERVAKARTLESKESQATTLRS